MHEVHEEYEKLLSSAKEVPAEKLAEMKEKLGEFAEYYLPKKEPEGFKDKIAHKASQFKEWVGSVVDSIVSSNESDDKSQKEKAKHEHDDKEKEKKERKEHEEKEKEKKEKEKEREKHETKLENLTGGIKEGIETAYEAVKNFSAEKLVNANEKLQTAKDMYHNVTEAAGEKMGDAADYTREKMANMSESIANMAEYSLDSMHHAVDYVITHAKHLSKEQMKKLREMFKAHEL